MLTMRFFVLLLLTFSTFQLECLSASIVSASTTEVASIFPRDTTTSEPSAVSGVGDGCLVGLNCPSQPPTSASISQTQISSSLHKNSTSPVLSAPSDTSAAIQKHSSNPIDQTITSLGSPAESLTLANPQSTASPISDTQVDMSTPLSTDEAQTTIPAFVTGNNSNTLLKGSESPTSQPFSEDKTSQHLGSTTLPASSSSSSIFISTNIRPDPSSAIQVSSSSPDSTVDPTFSGSSTAQSITSEVPSNLPQPSSPIVSEPTNTITGGILLSSLDSSTTQDSQISLSTGMSTIPTNTTSSILPQDSSTVASSVIPTSLSSNQSITTPSGNRSTLLPSAVPTSFSADQSSTAPSGASTIPASTSPGISLQKSSTLSPPVVSTSPSIGYSSTVPSRESTSSTNTQSSSLLSVCSNTLAPSIPAASILSDQSTTLSATNISAVSSTMQSILPTSGCSPILASSASPSSILTGQSTTPLTTDTTKTSATTDRLSSSQKDTSTLPTQTTNSIQVSSALPILLSSSDNLAPWIPTATSDAVTVSGINFGFNFLTDKDAPAPTPTDDPVSYGVALAAYNALISKMTDTSGQFDNLKSLFDTFNSALGSATSGGSSDDDVVDSVASAGSGLFNLFGSAFSGAVDVANGLEGIELSQLDTDGTLINTAEHFQSETLDFGKMINNVGPLMKSKLTIRNAKTLGTLCAPIVTGGIGILLKNLVAWTYADQYSSTITPIGQSTTRLITPTTPTSSSSSTSTKKPKATPTELYCINTVPGTTQAEYEDFVSSLPDGGTGLHINYPTINWQVYGSRLTPTQALGVSKHPVVRSIYIDSFIEETGSGDSYHVLGKRNERRADETENLSYDQQPSSPDHLRLLSQGYQNVLDRLGAKSPPPIPPYLLSPEAGQGITIFVIGAGINPTHPEFAKSYDPTDFYIVSNAFLNLPPERPDPNSFTGGTIPYVPDPDNIMSDSKNHESCVSSLATGLTVGVSKKAHLVPVKYKNSRGAVTKMAIQSAFMYIMDRVITTNAKPNAPAPGWAIINLSAGWSHENGVPGYPGGEFAARKDLLTMLFAECWKNDIVTVVAAGNSGDDPNFDLSQDVPACIGTTTNPLITVGACDMNGFNFYLTTKDAGKGGSITTSALGVGVQCASGIPSDLVSSQGTSLAAPQIAGLAAYFMSLPRNSLPAVPVGDMNFLPGPDLHVKGSVAQAVKDYVALMKYKRNENDAKSVDVSYNGAQEGLCEVVEASKVTKRRRLAKGKRSLAVDDYGLSPLVMSGALVPNPSYDPVCLQRSVL